MRQARAVALVVVLCLSSAGARAGTLTSATWLQTVEVAFPIYHHLAVPLSRTTPQLGATGTSTANSVAVSIGYPAFSTLFFVPPTPIDPIGARVRISQGGSQFITATPSMAAGTPRIPGTVTVRSGSHFSSMFMVGPTIWLAVPLGNGKAGQFTSTFSVAGAAHQITVDFYAWTPGTLTFMDLTTGGTVMGGYAKALPDVTAMGSFDLTANGGGTVTLVSPSKVSINGNLDGQRSASFASLKLNFVPEPSTLLLAGAATGVLVLRGVRVRR